MKYLIILCLTVNINTYLLARQHDTWYAFSDPENDELTGFKDAYEEEVRKFDHMLAVVEMTGDKVQSYYLTKSGRIVGRDSLFFFDNVPDCENEGFIRFHDKQTNRTGMFNRNGDIVIPAEYNALTKVMNGLVVGLKNAEKQYWHEHDEPSGCNHYSWTGGQSVLLDTANHVLIEDFNYEGTLDYYSFQITDFPLADSSYLNFKSVAGTCYSFIHIEKEFQRWLNEILQTDFSSEKLLAASYDSITWMSSNSWKTESKYDFIEHNFNILRDRLFLIKQPEFEFFIMPDGLNRFLFNSNDFDCYYDNCGDAKEWQYPVMSLILNHRDSDRLTQDHFDFLRTDKGYRLLSVSLRSGYLQ
ncbi:MAG: hypothetical protein LBH90_00035 [Tannerella sp.]|nr:hypothetical protein [Tannerella sp.]